MGFRIYRLAISFLIVLSAEKACAENAVTVKLMCWNLLNYPNTSGSDADTALRHPFYRTVIQHTNPDILITEENTFSNGTTWFLNSVMNANGAVYSKGTFINGPDTDNEVYFKSSEFTFISNTAIETDLRDINEFKLRHISTGDTIRIYAVHLKASSGSPNDSMRLAEADSLRKFTNALPAGSNLFVCGDFNFYGNYEPGYQRLLQNTSPDDGNFVDPIVMTGTWNYYPYRFYHTQSTRTTSFGGGATGGMNDRFDMILFSTAVSQGTSGVTYVPGSTTPVGNDGNHFDSDINTMPNTAVPQAVADALHDASDHLPVYALFNFSSVSEVFSSQKEQFQFLIFPNPVSEEVTLAYYLNGNSDVSIKIMNVLGEEVLSLKNEFETEGAHQVHVKSAKFLAPGIYFVNFRSNKGFFTSKFVKG